MVVSFLKRYIETTKENPITLGRSYSSHSVINVGRVRKMFRCTLRDSNTLRLVPYTGALTY